MSKPLKILVAGATGVIGRQLVQQLASRGHTVLATSRSGRRIGELPSVSWTKMDVLDQELVHRRVSQFQPDVIVSEVTSLPAKLNPRRLSQYYAANNKVRLEGTANLIAAATGARVTRFVSQSTAFWYAPAGPLVKEETAPFYFNAPEPFATAIRAMADVEAIVASTTGLTGVNLRYGHLYGPGTWYEKDGAIGSMMRMRAYPIIGDGEGVYSLIHVEDAAAATVAAIESDIGGTFNIVDDDPAPANEWMPVLAQALGAPKPMRVPEWLASILIGRPLVDFTVNQRGASNRKARDELGWRPRHSSWRQGFFHVTEGAESAEAAGSKTPVFA